MKAMASSVSPLLCTFWSVTIFAALVQSNYDIDTAFPGSETGDDDPLQPVTSNKVVAVGGTVTLTCRVKESDNSTLQWTNTAQQTLYFGEKRALRDNRIQLHQSTPTELSITISDVQLSDEGEYTCAIFTMPVRTARASVTVLGVPGNPQISGYEDPVQEGDIITLTCTSDRSRPPARLHWFRGNEEIEDQPDLVESDPDERTFRVSSKLELKVTRADNNAPVACVVEHDSLASGEKRAEQHLNVRYSPVVHIRPESDLPREGEKFHLQCVGIGNPEPTSYEWKKKDGELPLLAKVDGSFLRFELLNKSDNGVYLCYADNGIGRGQADYTLLVQDPTIPPSSPLASVTSLLSPVLSEPPSSAPTSPLFTSPPSPPPPASSSPVPPALTPSGSTYPSPSSSMSNALFPEATITPLPFSQPPPAASSTPSLTPPTMSFTPSSVSIRLNGFYSFTDATDGAADPTAMSTSSGADHAVIGGVVAVIVFILLCLLIVLGRYLIRQKGTYLTHEAKGADDAADADTAIINAEGGHSGAEDKKEYFI